MKLPDFITLSTEDLHAVEHRHGLEVNGRWEQLPEAGIFNAVYALDRYVLRIPRNHPAYIEALRREAIAVPAARRAGVRTPALVVFDDTSDVLPVPYAIYERVRGHALATLELEPRQVADTLSRRSGRSLERSRAADQPLTEPSVSPSVMNFCAYP